MKKILAMAFIAFTAAAAAEYQVGVYCDKGPAGIGAYQWYNLVEECPQLKLQLVDGADVRAGALEGLDVLVMPGGSSTGEYQSLQDAGMEQLRAFIRNGGGYIGTCAGCFLLIDQDQGEKGKRLHAVPYVYKGRPKGTIFLNHRFNEAGKAALGLSNDTWVVRFNGGAVMSPSTNVIEGAKFESWAKYASDADTQNPVTEANRTSGYDAVLGGTYGKGRVVVFGSHPEYFAGSVELVDAAFRWVLQDQSIKTVRHYRKPGSRPVAVVTSPMQTKDSVRAAMALNASDDYDVIPIDWVSVWLNELEHVDLVVFLNGAAKFNKQVQAIYEAYLAAGGKVVRHREGADILEEVAAAFAAPAAK